VVAAGFAIWLGASITGQVMRARTLRLLTPEREAEVHRLSWEGYLFLRFLQLDLLIVFIATALMWSGTAAITIVVFVVALPREFVRAEAKGSGAGLRWAVCPARPDSEGGPAPELTLSG
jgi:hypothetical protein